MATQDTSLVFPWKKTPKPGTKAKDLPHLREEFSAQCGTYAEAILQMMWLNPQIKIRELANCIGRERATVVITIGMMKDAHILQRIGSSGSGYWKIAQDGLPPRE